MTTGSYVVSHEVAGRVLKAVRSNAKDVTIVTASRGSAPPLQLTLIVSHIVSLTQHHQDTNAAEEEHYEVWRPGSAIHAVR